MKHSTAGSMTESYEPKVAIPCEGNCESVLQKLYVDLCNLIVESRIPGVNDRGYGDGIHCPPLLGSSTHICDLSKPECQKHQGLLHHLLRAVGSNVFEIEVLMLPECCAESKLKERIQNNEYVLLEKWSMKCIYRAIQPSIEVSQLLRAVRSFLHFSQISAWLSSTKGQSPSNLYYWVKPNLDGSSTKFDGETEDHSFPICKISDDLYGSIKVKFPARTEYVPIIPCSKHPPLRGYTFRTLNEDSSLCQNIPLNSQIVRQLHKTCDNQQDMLSTKSYVPEPAALVLTQASLLKTFASNLPDGSKSNRVLKHSNCQSGLLNVSNLPMNLNKSKNIDVSKSQTTFVCNYAETFTNNLSQENVCLKKRRFARHLHKTELKLRKLNKDASVSYAYAIPTEESPKPVQSSAIKHSALSYDASLVSNSCTKLAPNHNVLLKAIETSPAKEFFQDQTSQNFEKVSRQKIKTKAFKRKIIDDNADKIPVLPQKKMCCDINSSSVFRSFSSQTILSSQNIKTSQISNCFNSSDIDCNLPQQNLAQSSIHYQYIDCGIKSTVLEGKYDQHPGCSSSRTSENSNFMKQISNENNQNSQKNRSFSRLNLMKRINNKTCYSYVPNSENNACKKVKLSEDNFSSNFSSKLPSCSFASSNCFDSSSSTIYSCESDDCSFRKTHSKEKGNVYSFKVSKSHSEWNLSQAKELSKSASQPQNLDDCKNNTRNVCRKRKRKLSSKYIGLDHMLEDKNAKHEHQTSKSIAKHSNTENAKCMDASVVPINKRYGVKKLFKRRESVYRTSEGKDKIDIFKKRTRKQIESLKSISSHSSTENFSLSSISINNYQENDIIPKTNFPTQVSKTLQANDAMSSVPNFAPKTFSVNPSSKICRNQCASRTYPDPFSKPMKMPIKNQSLFIKAVIPITPKKLLYCTPNESLECFPRHISKFPKGRKLLGNFEESILKGCLPILNRVKGFSVEIGASGSFCPNHLTLPADVSFFELGNCHQGAAPYVAHVILKGAEYYLPKKGAVQVTLFNPSETVVKMFVLNYDFTHMPPSCHTFIRQKIYYLPVGSSKEHPSSQKWLRFIIHLRFASSKTGKIFLHNDFKIVVLNKTNDDAASEFNQEPRELRSFLSVPMNPTFSNF